MNWGQIWFYFSIISGALLFLGGLVLGSRKFSFGYATLLPIGVTLLASALPTGAMLHDVDRRAEAIAVGVIRASKETLDSADQTAVVLAIEGLAGHRAIAETVAEMVLNGGVYYTDHTYQATLSPLSGGNGQSLFRVDAVQSKKVHNPSDRVEEFSVNMQHFHLEIGNTAEFHEGMIYQLVSAEIWDKNGQRAGEVEYRRENLLITYPPGTARSNLSILPIQIPPHGWASYVIRTTSCEPRDRGELTVLVDRKTVDMKVSVTFPGSAFGGVKPEALVLHRGAYVTSLHTQCETSADPKTSTLSASISGGILPLNGIAITWKSVAELGKGQ